MKKDIYMNIMTAQTERLAFGEAKYGRKRETWDFAPAYSAVVTKDFFLGQSVKNVLIPGIGYGRNARIFRQHGMNVTGIEISETAFRLAHRHCGKDMRIYHGPVSDMPYDNRQYDGIFCSSLLHLLDEGGRAKLIADCYSQLAENGYMVFAVIAKAARAYGQGTFISKDRYKVFGGVSMFFYDSASIQAEFGNAGLVEITEITENYPFYLIKCRKEPRKSADLS